MNDGLLSPSPIQPGVDSYVVDYSTTSGTKTCWTGGPPAYPDMAANEREALTWAMSYKKL